MTKKQAQVFASTGGRARAQKLSPERRKAIARKAAAARWKGHKKNKKRPASL